MKLAATADKVIVDTPQGQPYIFYLFYGQYDPVRYQRELDLVKIGTPRHSFDFGKFEFRKITKEDQKLKNTVLVVAKERPEYYDFKESDNRLIEEIFSKDNGYPIYRIIYTRP